MKEIVVRNILRMVNNIVPKRDNIIYLRASFKYPDNIQAVLDDLLKRNINKKYKIYCVGNGFEKYHFENMVLLRDKSLKALIIFFVAKYVIWDVGIFYGVPFNSRQISINLWHGTSLKKIGFYEGKEKPYRTSKYAIAYSELFADKISRAFEIPIEDVLVTGEPRNDYLFNPATDSDLLKLGVPVNKNYKYIVWMPTFRQSKNHNVNNGKKYEIGFPFLKYDNLNDLNQCALDNDIILILKWHGSQVLPSNAMKSYSNIVFLTTETIVGLGLPFYSIVSRCDALITDYSSIYVNYLVLNRPICFAYDDIEEYISDRGFMFDDVESLMPGFKARSFMDVLNFVESVSNEHDEYGAERLRLGKTLNKYSDNENSSRLIDYLNL